MWEWCWKNRSRLTNLIDDVWQWERIETDLQYEKLGRMDTLHAAARGSCVCEGKWVATVVASFLANGIDIKELCKDVLHLLRVGRSPDTPVLALAGAFGGEGKSFFLKALLNVYGDDQVFESPVAGGFPLLGLHDSKVIFMDEWRFDTDVLPWSVQCLLYDGSHVPVKRPQNMQGITGHTKYKGTSPIFVTTKLADVEKLSQWAATDPDTGVPYDGDASMICRRLKVYHIRMCPQGDTQAAPIPGIPWKRSCISFGVSGTNNIFQGSRNASTVYILLSA